MFWLLLIQIWETPERYLLVSTLVDVLPDVASWDVVMHEDQPGLFVVL